MKKYILFLILFISMMLPLSVEAIQIFAKTQTGKHIALEVEPTTLVEEAKDLIYDKEGVPVYNQVLTFCDKVLEEGNTLQDYSIQKDSVILLSYKNEYNKYDLGQTLYINPITLNTCTKGSNNCLEWNVFKEDFVYNDKLYLLAKYSLGSVIPTKSEKKEYVCLSNNEIMTNITNEQDCSRKFNSMWKEMVMSYDIDNLLDFIKNKTSNWNDLLVINKTYDNIDYTNYKARLISSSEHSTIINSYSYKANDYSFLLDNNSLDISNGKRWTTSSYDSFYIKSLYLSNIDNSLNVGTWVSHLNDETVDFYPVIELDKSVLMEHTITKKVTNGNVTVSKDKGYYLDKISVTSVPNKGYVLDSISVNNNEIDIDNNTFIMPNTNVIVNVIFKPIEYKFTKGMDSIYNGSDLVFKLDGEYDLVDKIFVNNKELDNKYYTIASGSTIITLKNNYLKTLKADTYELKVSYTTGVSDKTNFIIKEVSNVDNPNTRDAIISYIVIGIFSILGIVFLVIYFIKCNKTR